MKKTTGINVKTPKKECNDKKCPFHGNIRPRGKTFTGVVLAKDTHHTATIEWAYPVLIPKYERSELRRTKIHVHNPACIDANIGDIVRIAETRPLSKTKNFVIIENLGKKKGFIEELAAREEAKVKEEKPTEEVKEEAKVEKKPVEESPKEEPKEEEKEGEVKE